MSKNPKTTNSIIENSRDRILDAAVTIFSQNGFEGARTRDIAALAKVNISTLHYHFQSKDNIYGCVIKKIYDLSDEYMMPVMIEQEKIIQNSQDKKEIIEALKVMSLTFVEMITRPENKRYSKIIAFEQIDQSQHFEMIFESVMKRVCQPFTQAVAKIIDKKSDSIEAILLTHSLHSTLTALQHNKSSLLYLTGWKGYDHNNIKHIRKNILRVIDSFFQPYL